MSWLVVNQNRRFPRFRAILLTIGVGLNLHDHLLQTCNALVSPFLRELLSQVVLGLLGHLTGPALYILWRFFLGLLFGRLGAGLGSSFLRFL